MEATVSTNQVTHDRSEPGEFVDDFFLSESASEEFRDVVFNCEKIDVDHFDQNDWWSIEFETTVGDGNRVSLDGHGGSPEDAVYDLLWNVFEAKKTSLLLLEIERNDQDLGYNSEFRRALKADGMIDLITEYEDSLAKCTDRIYLDYNSTLKQYSVGVQFNCWGNGVFERHRTDIDIALANIVKDLYAGDEDKYSYALDEYKNILEDAAKQIEMSQSSTTTSRPDPTEHISQQSSHGDPHVVEQIEEAPDVDSELDFETRMYRLGTSDGFGDDDVTAKVLSYNPGSELVSISLRLPDDSIGRLEYPIPEERDGPFVELVECAVAESNGKRHPVTLEEVHLLRDAMVPVEQRDGDWVVNIDEEYDWDADIEIDEIGEEESTSTIRSVLSKAIQVMLFAYSLPVYPAIFFFSVIDGYDPVEQVTDAAKDVWVNGPYVFLIHVMATILWIIILSVLY